MKWVPVRFEKEEENRVKYGVKTTSSINGIKETLLSPPPTPKEGFSGYTKFDFDVAVGGAAPSDIRGGIHIGIRPLVESSIDDPSTLPEETSPSLAVLLLLNDGASLRICELMKLIELDVSINKLEGHLPTCLNSLTNLRALELSYNHLIGNLPSVIANLMMRPEYLSLWKNNFEGLFSFSSLANLLKLEIFHLSTENSTLQVLETEEFLQPPNQLKVLYLRKCNLHVIPSFLMYQHSLEFIDLSHNKLVGMFPTWLLHNNTRLQGMYLTNNSLIGNLQLPNSTHDLLELKISSNNLNGQLLKNLSMILPKLFHLDLSENKFEVYIPSSTGEMKRLKILDLSSNNFSGELPNAFVSGYFSLQSLRLSNNNFHGNIFPEFMNMTQLRLLYLDNNQFSGKIQDGLSKASFVEFINLSNNRFLGQIPQWIGNFSNLLALFMSNNFLEGGVPIQLSNIKGLSFLDISKNILSGSMASSFNLSSMWNLYMQKNALSASIPNAVFKSSYLVALDLSDNNFSRSIPNQIDDKRTNLRFLLLRGDHLKGHIPHELCDLKRFKHFGSFT
ncbi:hypothetical protein LWI28_012838 [Acer negundo]|uniref:Uncharacterized protein n=1 Tax=Acer negundo TaxID=4023 RepID=A0AAD5IA92_ACENE|nr:hypothetical protein LWI28_012838 [Acer negundo]